MYMFECHVSCLRTQTKIEFRTKSVLNRTSTGINLSHFHVPLTDTVLSSLSRTSLSYADEVTPVTVRLITESSIMGDRDSDSHHTQDSEEEKVRATHQKRKKIIYII